MTSRGLWERYKKTLCTNDAAGVRVDISRMDADDAFFAKMSGPIARAFAAMDRLEAGEIANPDEKRMVGHYWLRAPERAPSDAIRREIQDTVARVKRFAASVHSGSVRPERADAFRNLLVVGIGGSALGPEFVSTALTAPEDRMRVYFFDNTDPDGMDRVLAAIGDGLSATLTVVISKSGGTKETRNGMLEAAAAYRKAGLSFERHAVAITSDGSELDKLAKKDRWLDIFPMWDWVGGRTSELSAVGLLPAALQGIDIDGMLAGARAMDEATRSKDARANPAALMALMWYSATDGRGKKDMVVLPYKDRLELFSRYLQQLVMESLGKELDLHGVAVNQGIAVYGNKGSTDQHAYVQQLRDGVNNFFVTFIEVLSDRKGPSMEVEPGVTSGDFLFGFYLGTRRALYEKGRGSITVTIPDVSPRSVGGLIALYERSVGLYASLIEVNAYHQPGVEAGKKAAGAVIALQGKILARLRECGSKGARAEEIARAIGAEDEVETIFKILEHLAANPSRGVKKQAGAGLFDATYSV